MEQIVGDNGLRPEPPGLYSALAARARNSSDARLVSVESLALIVAIGILFWVPDISALAFPPVALAMFAVWGVAEHVRLGRAKAFSRPAKLGLAALQFLAAALGTVSAAAALLAAVFAAIGTVIS